MKSPGSYVNVGLAYTEDSKFLRGRPLLSVPVLLYPLPNEGRTLRVEFLRPRRRGKKGAFSSRVKINGATFSLALISPRKGEPYLDGMFEDAEGFVINASSAEALFFLKIDTAARRGEPRALALLAATEAGLFLHQLLEEQARREAEATPFPPTTP